MQDVPIRVNLHNLFFPWDYPLLEFIKAKEYIGSYNTKQRKETKNSLYFYCKVYTQIIPCRQLQILVSPSLCLGFLPNFNKTLHQISTSGRQYKPHAKSQIAWQKVIRLDKRSQARAIRTMQATRAGQVKLKVSSCSITINKVKNFNRFCRLILGIHSSLKRTSCVGHSSSLVHHFHFPVFKANY